jgi:hypothetical protein
VAAAKSLIDNPAIPRVLIAGLTNQTTMQAGVMDTVTFIVAPNATPGPVTISITNMIASDPMGLFTPISGVSGTLTIVTTTAPLVPANLSAKAVSTSQINLTWDASIDPFGTVAGYDVYRNGVFIVSTTTNAYNDSGLSPGTEYTYTVSAFDSVGQTSAQSSPVIATTLTLSGSASTFAPRAYPSPWRSDQNGSIPITIDRLAGTSTIKIFTVSGHLVKSWSTTSASTPWNRDNDSGDTVASGLYFYVITNDLGQKASGKVVIIK